MENQNNQNDKPADGYAQAPQQEEKSVLAELAEFVSRKKEAAQSVNVPAEAKQNVEKAQNTASAADEVREDREIQLRNVRKTQILLRMRKRRRKESRELQGQAAARQPERKRRKDRQEASVQPAAKKQKNRQSQSARPEQRNLREQSAR